MTSSQIEKLHHTNWSVFRIFYSHLTWMNLIAILKIEVARRDDEQKADESFSL